MEELNNKQSLHDPNWLMHTVPSFPEKESSVELLPYGCFILRKLLNDDQQMAFYRRLLELSNGTVEKEEMQNIDYPGPWPLCFWEHPYTKASNISEKPTDILDWGDAVYRFIVAYSQAHKEDLLKVGTSLEKIQLLGTQKMDTIYAQLYRKNGFIQEHEDVGLNWGMSVSFGCSCLFYVGSKDNVFTINSGDVVIANFGEITHCMPKILDEKPNWWVEDPTTNLKLFNKARCNIQLRDKSAWDKPPAFNLEQYKQYLHHLNQNPKENPYQS